MESFDGFDGRTAVITGAGGGIGAGLARALGERGARLVLADIQEAPLAETAGELATLGHDVATHVCDVRDLDAVESLATFADERFGGAQILCNNAGVAAYGLLADQDVDDWRFVMDVDFWGVMHGIKAFVPRMIAAGTGGHILNTASMAGLIGMPGLGIYSAAKFGVVGVSEALRAELKPHGIGVSVLCPMMVSTALNSNSDHIRAGMQGKPSGELISEENTAGLAGDVMSVDELVDAAIRGITDSRLHILTHRDQADILEHRARRLADAAERVQR